MQKTEKYQLHDALLTQSFLRNVKTIKYLPEKKSLQS